MIKYRMKVLTYGKITLDWKVMKNEIIDLLAKAQGYESTNPRKKAQAAADRISKEALISSITICQWADFEKNEDFSEDREVLSEGKRFSIKHWLKYRWDMFKLWLWNY